MRNEITIDNLFEFDVPELWNPNDTSEISYNLERLAMCAFYLAGDDQMDLEGMVDIELDMTMDEYDADKEYEEAFDELIDITGGYNFFITENKLSDPLIKLIIDDKKTAMLNNSDEYKIYKVVLCD